MIQTIRAFEYQSIRIGESLTTTDGVIATLTDAQHATLAKFSDETKDKYFACGRRNVRFQNYVGFIQVGKLGIEILPKVDRASVADPARWHRVLLDMLRVAGNIKIDTPDRASLNVQHRSLLELLVKRLLRLCADLLRQGLAKGYRTVEENRSQFRGRLLVSEHLRRNLVRQDKFFVAHSVYDYAIPANLVLHEALLVLARVALGAELSREVSRLRSMFPDVPRWSVTSERLDNIHLTRATARYREALTIARLLMMNLGPQLSSGREPLLAMLFDMNKLWESYVAAIARKVSVDGVTVRTQDSRAFWKPAKGNRRMIRPDITVRRGKQTELVIDTKWKMPRDGKPSIADLRQMFAYNELFESPRAMLLYPSPRETHFGSHGSYAQREHTCTTGFLNVLKDVESGLQLLLCDRSG